MGNATLWWLLAGIAVAAELLTGTFYLLMLAFGFAASAIAAHLGANQVVQTLVAGAVGGGAVVMWHLLRNRRTPPLPAGANRDVNLDVGETVFVDAWNADGTGSVQYRGARWTVMHRPGNPPATGTHRVAEVIGNRLLVDKV